MPLLHIYNCSPKYVYINLYWQCIMQVYIEEEQRAARVCQGDKTRFNGLEREMRRLSRIMERSLQNETGRKEDL